MANKYLDNDGVLYLWNKVKSLVSGAVPTKTSDLTNDSGFITSADVPEGATASTSTPLMDGTAAVGSSTAFARGDHVHPSDTAKVDVSTFNTAMAQAQQAMNAMVTFGSTTGDGGAVWSVVIENNQNPKQSYEIPTAAGLTLLDAKYISKTTLEDYVKKADVTNAYIYRGSRATISDLPSAGNTTGDVYNVEATGMNYAWNGTAWDALGEIFTITAITNSELDTICV